MLYFDRIDVSEGNDVNKTKKNQKSVIFVTISGSSITVLSSSQMSAIDVMI